MKLTLIRTARETGKETFSTWPSDTVMEKIICPAAEYTRSKEGERYLKTYNGLVQIEVTHLALLTDPSGNCRKTRGTEYHVVKKE